MTIDCPRGCRGKWRATGRTFLSRRQRQRAQLVCDVCGTLFSSGLPEAIEAAKGVTPERAEAPPVPVPSLPLPIQRAPDFVSVGAVSSRRLDARMRQFREPGEDG